MTTKEVGVRLSVKDKEAVERALRSLGQNGEDALKRIGRAAEQSSVSLHALDAAANGINRGMDKLRAGVALTAAALGAGFLIGIKSAIARLEEMDRLSAAVDHTLEKTGNTAKTSAAELAAFADGLELRTGRAAEEIMSIGANLASYKFDNEVFYRSIELANDMSAAWGGDLRQNLEGLARALAEPEKGFAMLQKRGISLTDAQGDLVKRFMAVNDLASAQRVILGALEGDIKGVAEKALTPMEKATKAAEKAMEDLFEDLVRGDKGGEDLRVSIERVAQTLSDPNVLQAVRMFGNTLVSSLRVALEFIGGVSAGLQRLIDFFSELEGKSNAGLDERLYGIGREIVDLDAERLKLQSGLSGKRNPLDVTGMIEDNFSKGRLEEVGAKMAELRAEEAQIMAMQSARTAAANLTAPLPSVALPGTGPGSDVPPPVLTPEQARQQEKSLREAQQLTERLRTAAESYAAAVANVDAMLSQGLITQETHNRAVAQAVLDFAGAASGANEYRQAQEQLEKALQSGIISETQYADAVDGLMTRRLAASNDWLAGIERGLKKISQGAGDLGGGVETALSGAAKSFEDALVSAFKSGKIEWDDLQSTIVADLFRMGLQQGMGGLSSILSGLITPGKTGGFIPGLTGPTLNAKGNVYSSPSLSAFSNQVHSTPKLFSFAKGVGEFAEAGPEAIMPLGRDSQGRLGVRSASGGQSGQAGPSRVEVHNYSGMPSTEERTRSSDGVDVTRIVIGTVNTAIAEGRFDGSLGGSYGLTRKGV